MRQFYAATKAHLPPTRDHPEPSPFEAFAHAYSLVSTRAFVIDLYHLIALCPFADILNHSGAGAHTSLASDDFVCHRCGSLQACEHDGEEVGRLAHLGERERERLKQPDTVDMYVEWPVRKGKEVMNAYGEGLSDARLLVEWGFVPSGDDDDSDGESNGDSDRQSLEPRIESLAGEACTWEPEELLPSSVREVDAVEAADAAATRLFTDTEDFDSLLCRPSRGVYHINHAGQASLRLFAALYARHAPVKYLLGDACVLAEAATAIQDGAEVYPLPEHLKAVARDMRDLMQARMDGMHHAELDIGQLHDLRDVSCSERRG